MYIYTDGFWGKQTHGIKGAGNRAQAASSHLTPVFINQVSSEDLPFFF